MYFMDYNVVYYPEISYFCMSIFPISKLKNWPQETKLRIFKILFILKVRTDF